VALWGYQDEHGRLPPAAVCGDYGQPLLSWRVLLLPYVDQEKLYKEFKLDEPWDGPHNIHLLSRMPAVYAPPPGKASRVPPNHTVCKVFVGKGAAFEGSRGLSLAADFPDGTSNTILVFEGGEPVPWSKPEDLVYDPSGPLPDLRGLFRDLWRVVLADGSGHYVKQDVSEATLRAAITRNGRDTPGPDW
jgi:hypothetical protein